MLNYHVDIKIDGISIQLIESKFSYVVIYGMEYTVCDDLETAAKKTESCIKHAMAMI